MDLRNFKYYTLLLPLFLLGQINTLSAQQSVTIGGEILNDKAVLMLVSAQGNQGLMLPVVTSKEVVQATASEKGLVVFDAGDDKIYSWNGNNWIDLVGSGSVSVSSISDLNDVDVSGAATGQVLKWNGSAWVAASDESGGSGSGSDDQQLTFDVGTKILSIENGNTVDLSSLISAGGADDWGSQVVVTGNSLRGEGTAADPLQLDTQGAGDGQVLKWDETVGVWVPANDNVATGGGAVNTNPRLVGDGTAGNPLDLANQGAANGQVLKWDDNQWAPADDQTGGGGVWQQNSGNDIYYDGGQVGIGVNSGLKGALQVAEGQRVIFGADTIGEGAKLMWLGDLGAFRLGTLTSFGTGFWDPNNIGNNSFAYGSNSQAQGIGSFAGGNATLASGSYATAFGFATRAQSSMSMAIGRYNVGWGRNGWYPEEPIFEIGNGFSLNARQNAFTVLKNGNVGIDHHIPQAKLHITGGPDIGLNSSGGFLLFGSTREVNMVMDINEIMVRDNGGPSTLHLQTEGGDVRVGGTLVHSSDKRLKKNIQDLSYGLIEVLKLSPVKYEWKSREDNKKYLGLIAQEVQKVIPEIVSQIEEDETLTLGYTELIPVLIKAMQEQQGIIQQQQGMMEQQGLQINQLINRIVLLEQSGVTAGSNLNASD